MQSQTKIFSRLVRDYMRPAAVKLPVDSRLADVLAGMIESKASSALITARDGNGNSGRLVGIITEKDVTRRIALRCDGGETAEQLMTSPVRTILAADYLYKAIADMRRFGWRHMPVVDEAGYPLGVIDLHDALSVAGEEVVHRIDLLSHEGSLEGLRAIKAAQVELAESLLSDSVPAPEIQALITHVNNDIHRRVIEANLEAMKEQGLGEPPVDFCLIIMGSGGRGENYLYPDQDNGFILDDYPDGDHTRIDGYFIDLAERMNRDLDQIGFPYCRGHVMARNPLWRKTRSQWRAQIGLWGRKRSIIAIQLSDIFFDFRGTYGVIEWAGNLRRDVTKMAKASPALLRELHEEVSRKQVALGWFGRLITEKDDPEHKGAVNLKHSGTLPLVSNLRLLALKHGIDATGTKARIDALRDLGVLGRDEWDYLRGAFDHITGLLLRQQLADFRNPDRQVSNFVYPEEISERERDLLIDSLKAIGALAGRVAHEFTGDIF